MTQAQLQPLDILSSLGINSTPTVTAVQGEFDLDLWKVEDKGQSYALRVFRPGRQEDCDRERAALAAARAAGLPAPEVRQAGIWHNHPALLITWLPGRTIAEDLRARPWRLWRLGILFGRMQAAIHRTPAPALLQLQPEAWIAWKCEGEPTIQASLRHLPLDTGTLLHLDYHPLNVLTDGKRITGIVDWTNAHAGDPRADAARTVAILRVDPAVRKPVLQRLSMRIFALAWRRGYQRAGGHLHEMSLFYAWAGTVLQHDLTQRYQHLPQELAPARHWTNKWKARVGCEGVQGA
jgi:aminoglycoside phosphotransferase (APT) family kinase protein